MSEQNNQADEKKVADDATPTSDVAIEASGIQSSPPLQPPEDSREEHLKKAQAETNHHFDSNGDPTTSIWMAELTRFNDVVNDVLVSKEKLRLNTLNSKIRPEFPRDWVQDCNRLFSLAVNLKRRRNMQFAPKTPPDLAV